MFEAELASASRPNLWIRMALSVVLVGGGAFAGSMVAASTKNSLAIPYALYVGCLVGAMAGGALVSRTLPFVSAPVLVHLWNLLLFAVPAAACWLLFAVGCGFGDRNCKGPLALGAFAFIPLAAIAGFAWTVYLGRSRARRA